MADELFMVVVIDSRGISVLNHLCTCTTIVLSKQ